MSFTLRKYAGLTALIVALIAAAPAASHGGHGVVVEPNPSTAENIGALNPLLCSDADCQRINDFLYPTLFATDPATGVMVGAAPDNQALAVNPALQPGDVQTLHLRDDLSWSDGVPVTAYDVFYSYLATMALNSPSAARSTSIVGARVNDDHTIAFQYQSPDCSSLARTNLTIAPAHTFDPDFAAFVSQINATDSDIKPFKDWLDAYPQDHWAQLSQEQSPVAPTATAGEFQFNALRPSEDIRLLSGETAFVYADVPDGLSPVDFFLDKRANVLMNPPYERRDDLRAAPGLQISDVPGGTWEYIIFNTGDPQKPKSAFDDQGQPIDQGHHPLFGDVRVRQAVQLAIDDRELAEIVFQGDVTPLASSLPPMSWGFNPDLTPSAYDPRAAERLLDEAGWRDANNDGIRECHGCLYAHEGDPLSFNLNAEPDDTLYEEEDIIVRQLARVGFSVNAGYEDLGALESQTFDAYLTLTAMTADAADSDPDQSLQFTRAADKLDDLSNVGSFYDEPVDSLIQQARSVPDCAMDARAQLYRQIGALLQQDQPYAWLHVRNDMYLAQAGVLGFAPYPGRPFWNIRDWVVLR